MGLFNTHVESFFEHLRAAGYAEKTLRKKRWIAKSFARWTMREQVAVEDLNESHVTSFLKHLPRRRKARVELELAVLRLFLRYLRLEVGVAPLKLLVESSPVGEIHGRYVDYLRGERGLAENSICVYAPYIRDFLAEQHARSGFVSSQHFSAQIVQDFLLLHIRGRSNEYARLLSTALRSFLRFLYFQGETLLDLSRAIPMVRRWRQATVPAFLSPEEVENVLLTTDCSTPCGRRDYAVLILLARLGLRAGEVVGMELDDINWREGEIIVRGKGRVLDRLPLLSSVGDALALYLHEDRGRSASRKIFLRMWAPRIGLVGPAAVGHIVRRAFVRAGLRRTSRGAAHLFRHSLATRMIRHGASIAEIAEVLRHRSQGTTEIYAKVAFETLRGVARPWPGTGGAR